MKQQNKNELVIHDLTEQQNSRQGIRKYAYSPHGSSTIHENKHDPGWNDPPTFTYEKASAIQISAQKKGTLLNKRVAYPIGGKVVNSNINPVTEPTVFGGVTQLSAPPPASCTLSQGNRNTQQNPFESLSKSEKMDKTLKNLDTLIPNDKEDEIHKRIKIMEKMWIDDKLEEDVQCKLVSLSEALVKGNIELADQLQMGLMIDYVSQCCSWMSGIRQIINIKRQSKDTST